MSVIFSGTTANNLEQLWITDGTTAGTTQLLNGLNPGGDASIYDIFTFGNFFAFSANDGVHGIELWVSDGTAIGTHMLKDINPGAGDGVLQIGGGGTVKIATIGDRVIFTASTTGGNRAQEYWITDGTEAGTQLFTPDAPLPLWYYFQGSKSLAGSLGGKIFYESSNNSGAGLFCSDGTVAGTKLLNDLGGLGVRGAANFQRLGDKLLFATPATDTQPAQLWTTDGTESGTSVAANLSANSYLNLDFGYVVAGNNLIFAVNDLTSGTTIWTTDGTTAGTRLVKNISGPDGAYFFVQPKSLGNSAIFITLESSGTNVIWTTDGTSKGTVPLKTIGPEFGPGYFGSFFVNIGDKIFFDIYTYDTNGIIDQHQMWETDGTVGGTQPYALDDQFSLLSSSFFAVENGLGAVFGDWYSTLWSSDGTAAGTQLFTSNQGPWPTAIRGFVPFNLPRLDFVLSSKTVNEGAVVGSTIGTISSLDPDSKAPRTYSIVNDPSHNFSIDGDKIVVNSSAALDYEQNKTILLTIRCVDATGKFVEKTIEVRVSDVTNEQNFGDGNSNLFVGGRGRDFFDGGGGADTYVGGAGNDTYVVDGTDSIVERAKSGSDTVQSSIASIDLKHFSNVENARLTGDADLNLSGNGLNNRLTGNAGDNTIFGGAGRDILSGGAGHDTFVFQSATESRLFAGGADVITDFVHGEDTIDVSGIDARTSSDGNQAFSWIGGQSFHGNPGELHYFTINARGTSRDLTIVEGDVNGDGIGDFQIALKGLHLLTASDFVL